ncbi:MAG TPA: hypothetical protein VL486_11940 [Verrucomicrobiae bacterium]|nr:hypothetical protein [Verrucomicrobiae bacterium]
MRSLLVALLALLVAGSTQAASIEARLIRASNDKKVTDPSLRDIEPRLKRRFGYEYYQLLGVQQEVLREHKTYRLNLGEGFVVFVTPKSTSQRMHEMDLEWTSGKASLVKTTVKIAEGNHLFIKGPGVGDDWIVLVVTLRE